MAGSERDDDDALVRAAAAGDGEAFARFYRRHLRAVVRLLTALARDPEVVADLTAETFAAALVGAGRYRPGEAPAAAWLLGIARNKHREHARRGRVGDEARRRLGLERLDLDDADLARIDDLGRPEVEAVRVELERLPPAEREAVRGHVLDGLGYRELATRTNATEPAVRQRVSRGLARLRRRLEEDR